MLPNENEEAVDDFDDVKVPESAGGLSSPTADAIVEGNEANEKAPPDAVGFKESLDELRFSEKLVDLLLSLPKPEKPDPKPPKDGVVEPKSDPDWKGPAVVVALPKPLKTEGTDVVGTEELLVSSVAFDPASKGLAVLPDENENVLALSLPAPVNKDEKLGVPDGALMVTEADSSFFSGILNVKEAFSLLPSGLVFSCAFSTTLGCSTLAIGVTLFANGIEKVAETATFVFEIVDGVLLPSELALTATGFKNNRGA